MTGAPDEADASAAPPLGEFAQSLLAGQNAASADANSSMSAPAIVAAIVAAAVSLTTFALARRLPRAGRLMLISSYVMKFWVNLYARDYGGFGVVLAIYF
jgi:hypothetical protein